MENFNTVPDRGTFGGSVEVINQNFSLAQQEMESLRQAYNSLSKNNAIPVTELPATGEAGKIYRLAGTTSYADYMYAEGALTTPIKMAEYDNAIDDEPTAGSDNLVKSGGIFGIYEKLGTGKDLSRNDFTIFSGAFISGDTGKFGVSSTCEYMYIPVETGQVFKLTRGNTAGYAGSYAFLVSITEHPTYLKESDNVGFGYVDLNSVVSVTIPAGCNYLAISNKNYGTNMAMDKIEQINEYNFNNVKEDISSLHEDIEDLKSCELSENDFTIFSGAFISGDTGKFGVSSTCEYMYRKVRQGEKYELIRNNTEGNPGAYVFLVSITENPTYLEESDNVGYGIVDKGETISITIPSGCNFLAISNLNYGTNMRMDKIISHSYGITFIQEEINTLKNPKKKIYCIPVYGQSLAIGVEAVRISSYSRFKNSCLTTPNLTLVFDGNNEVSSYGLIDSVVDNFAKEKEISTLEQDFKVLSFARGQGAVSIVELKKGTQNYENFISSLNTAYTNAVNNGFELIVPAFCWVQGEHDRFDGYTNDYKGELTQLRQDVSDDVVSITGQSVPVHCIVYQTNQLSLVNSISPGTFEPTSYNSGAQGACISVPQAQYELVRDNQYFHASSPIYPFKVVPTAHIHIDGQSQKLLGYYEGLAAERIINAHNENIGLYVTNVTKVDSTHIKIVLNTPCPPLVFDTVSVNEVANYGFSVITPNNENIIQSVAITSNHYSSSEITITTSSDCTNAKLRYGINGDDGRSGYKQGSRGNVRDSQGLIYAAFINEKRVEMHNWLYFFEALIS